MQHQAAVMQDGLTAEAGEQAAREWMVQVRRQIRYTRLSTCFTCGVPQSICHGWEGEAFAYRRILIPLVAQMLFGHGQAGRRAAWPRRLQQHGISMEDPQQVIPWLGQPSGPGWSYLFEGFCWLYQL